MKNLVYLEILPSCADKKSVILTKEKESEGLISKMQNLS